MSTTFDPTRKHSNITLSNGNRTATITTGVWVVVLGTHGLYQSGKGYFELTCPVTNYYMGGVAGFSPRILTDTDYYHALASNGWGYRSDSVAGTASKYHSGDATNIGVTTSANAIMQIAVDAGARKMWFGINNTWLESGDPANGINPGYGVTVGEWTIFPAVSLYLAQSPMAVTAHFASGDLVYSPPSGFSAWDDVATITEVTGSVRVAASTFPSVDLEHGGNYQITGTVTELGLAGRYRVRLFDRRSARCIRETWSASDGTYSFPYIAYRANGYFVVAYDHGGSPLNAAIADLVTPEPMP